MMKNEKKIRQIIEKELSTDLKDTAIDDMLLEGAIGVDSISSIRIIVALENEFNIEFDDEELLESTFSSLKNLVSIVNRHLSD